MQSTKDLIEGHLKANYPDVARDLATNPSFLIIKQVVQENLLSHTPGTIAGEYVSQEMFFNTGLSSLFRIIEAAAVEDADIEDVPALIELEEEPSIEQESPLED